MAPRATHHQIKQAARLAGVELTPGELELFRGQLAQLLAHMERLGRLPDEALEGKGEECDPRPLREDEPGGSPLAGSIMARAPKLEEGYFSVPRPGRPGDAEV